MAGAGSFASQPALPGVGEAHATFANAVGQLAEPFAAVDLPKREVNGLSDRGVTA